MKKTSDGSEEKVKHEDGPTFLDGGWGWVVVVASFLSQTLIGSVYFGYGVLLPEWMEEFDSSSALTSFIGGAASGAISGSGPFASFLIHKWGCRTTHMVGGFMIACAFVACSFARSMVQIFVLYSIIGGIGGGLCYIPSIITISKFFKEKRSIAIGIVSSGCGFGAFVFPVVFEYLMQQYGWRGVMLIAGAINGNMIAFGLVMCPVHKAPRIRVVPCIPSKKTKGESDMAMDSIIESEEKRLDYNDNIRRSHEKDCIKTDMISVEIPTVTRKRRRSSFQIMRAWLRHPLMRRKSSMMRNARQDCENIPTAEQDDVFVNETLTNEEMDASALLHCNSKPKHKTFAQQAAHLLTNSRFYILLFHNFTMFFGSMIVFGLTPLRASVDFGMTASQGAMLLSAIGMANLCGRFLWGIAASFRRIEATTLFISLRLTGGIITLVSPLANTFGPQITYCISAGLLFGNWSIYPIVVADQFGDGLLTVAYGMLEAANGLGSVIGPMVGGYMFDLWRVYKFSFLLSGSVLIGGVVPLAGLHYWRRTKHKITGPTSIDF